MHMVPSPNEVVLANAERNDVVRGILSHIGESLSSAPILPSHSFKIGLAEKLSASDRMLLNKCCAMDGWTISSYLSDKNEDDEYIYIFTISPLTFSSKK